MCFQNKTEQKVQERSCCIKKNTTLALCDRMFQGNRLLFQKSYSKK